MQKKEQESCQNVSDECCLPHGKRNETEKMLCGDDSGRDDTVCGAEFRSLLSYNCVNLHKFDDMPVC